MPEISDKLWLAVDYMSGNNANAEKLSADAPNHCLTEPDFALDFIAHDLCRTATDANDSQFQSLHGWRPGLPHQNVENIFIGDDGLSGPAPSRAGSLPQVIVLRSNVCGLAREEASRITAK